MANDKNKYVGLEALEAFLANIRTRFAAISHKHSISELTDYTVDAELSSTSTNPVQNKVIDAEFEAMSQAMQALEGVVDTKADASVVAETYETKADAQAKYDELANVQSDWNQGDENASDYIKNRPFYEVENVLGNVYVNETTLTSSDLTYDETAGYKAELMGNYSHDANQLGGVMFEVVYNGVAYTMPLVRVYSGYGYLGTQNLMNSQEYPFSIWTQGSGKWSATFATSDTHTIKVTRVESVGELVQLDEKFIPSTIARNANIEATYATKSELSASVANLASTTDVANAIDTHNTATDAHADIRETLAAVKEDVDAFFKDATLSEAAKDTLKEIQEYIDSDVEAAAQMAESISKKAEKATTLAGYGITDAYTMDATNELLSGYVEKVTGKGLSTNDLTDALKSNYDNAYTHSQDAHAPANAQANVLEGVKVNGTTLTISNKTVDIAVPTDNTQLTNGAGYLVASDIANKAEKATTLAGYGITDAYTTTRTDELLSGKVDKVTGKGLSTNDLTNALKANYDLAYEHSQVAHAPAGAQANVIESIKVNGSALTISGKAVDITVPVDNSELTNGAGYLVASDIANKANKATTLAGYGITDAYTNAQTDTAIATAISNYDATWEEITAAEVAAIFVE